MKLSRCSTVKRRIEDVRGNDWAMQPCGSTATQLSEGCESFGEGPLPWLNDCLGAVAFEHSLTACTTLSTAERGWSNRWQCVTSDLSLEIAWVALESRLCPLALST